MSLILDRCYFCLFKKATEVVDDAGDEYHLCESCAKQFHEASANSGKNVLELPRQNPSDICCQCGLCCVALVARVEKGEAEEFIRQANKTGRHPKEMTMEKFCAVREDPPYRGEYVMNFPCPYLKGHVLDYVACRGYDLDRPAVCGSYLCKIAVQYKLGLISLGEARFSLRASFINSDVGIFNWNQGDTHPDETRISVLSQVAAHLDRVKEAGVPEEHWEWAAAMYLTPEYLPSSDYARSWLNMHLHAVDREDFRLEAYVEPEIIEKWSEGERDAASHVMEMVLRDIRQYFVRSDQLVTKEVDQSGEDKDDPSEDQ